MSINELEIRIEKMQEWESLAAEAAAEAEAIRDTIKAEMLERNTEELQAGRFIIRWTSVVSMALEFPWHNSFPRKTKQPYSGKTRKCALRNGMRWTIKVVNWR